MCALQVSRVRQTFELLGGGMDDVSLTIDKQARVELSWVASPETCGDGGHFEYSFDLLIRRVSFGTQCFNTCCYEPQVGPEIYG